LAIAHLGAEDWFGTLRAYKNAAADVQYFDLMEQPRPQLSIESPFIIFHGPQVRMYRSVN